MSTPEPPDADEPPDGVTHPGPPTPPARGKTLPCGTDPDRLLAQAAEGRGATRDAHQDQCPHCQASLAEFTRLWARFDAAAAVPTPAPPGVMDRALAAIRRQAGPSGWGRVEDAGGSFLVAARVVVAVAGQAARTSPGVRMALSALGELTSPPDDIPTAEPPGDYVAAQRLSASAGVRGQSVAVELTVAAEYGQNLHSLARGLRSRVVEEVAAQTGLQVVEVDVNVTDVFLPRGRAPSG